MPEYWTNERTDHIVRSMRGKARRRRSSWLVEIYVWGLLGVSALAAWWTAMLAKGGGW